jgi:hypothetical protein
MAFRPRSSVQLTLHGFQPGQPGGHFQLAGAQLVVFAFEVGLHGEVVTKMAHHAQRHVDHTLQG